MFSSLTVLDTYFAIEQQLASCIYDVSVGICSLTVCCIEIFCTCIYSWEDAAKFLTGFSSIGSIAIPAILRHADLITGGAMWFEFTAFFILLSTVMIFQHVSQEDDF